MEEDTSRAVVQTYVPAYQRDQWDEHADELDMSRSEFVKTMVQAGRRVFDGHVVPQDSDDEHQSSEAPTNRDSDLADRVIERLDEDGPLQWDDLLREVSGDIETRLENTLQQLQEENSVRYSGRAGGYVLEDEAP